jgi:S-DNA-T family DNA segregation ATPase FtsK/SpoIIIE
MDLRLSVLDPRRAGAMVDVAVRAPAGTPLSAVRADLLAAVGADRQEQLCHDGVALDDAAPLGVAPLLQGATLTAGPPTVPAATLADRARLEAHVIAGPDAGDRFPLPPGTWCVGRGSDVHVRLADTAVSRAHAEIDVDGAGARIRDVGSSNGTRVDGRPVARDGTPRALPEGSPVRLGHSTLTVRTPAAAPASVLPDGAGRLVVNRAPRVMPEPPPVTVAFPEPPPDAAPLRPQWASILAPALLAVPLALIWHQPVVLLLGLASPVVLVLQSLARRRRSRRDGDRAAAAHQAALARAEQELAAAMTADAAALEHRLPDLATVAAIAELPSHRLWERPAGAALHVRIGLGRVPADVRATGPPRPAGHHPSAPLSLDLADVHVLGVAGPRSVAVGLVRAALGQLAVLHAPHDLRLSVICADDVRERDWEWLAWLPHVVPASEVTTPVRDRTSPRDPPRPRTVVVLDGASRLRRRPDVSELLGSDTRSGVHAVCIDDDAARLPTECTATVTVQADPDGGSREQVGLSVLSRRGPAQTGVPAEPAPARWAHQIARHLAPLRAAPSEGSDGALPEYVRLLDLPCGFDPTRSQDLIDHWARGGYLPRARLGVTETAPFQVDLRQDGPHVLIAGTTGAGKSELLKTLVADLAVACPPERLSLLLIDYKGGAAFAPCVELPHVTGLLTDLDEHLARRALAGLAAELRRRERLLRAAGVPDVDTYQGLPSPGAGSEAAAFPPLPRLVIVVDEFRVLVEEMPDFVAGLVRTAAVGRSLGVHLVLATQRPAGAVSADIRANVNLRIALRVRDPADSEDVVGVADAACLDPRRPGRAVARTGGDAPVTFQAATVSDRSPQPISVRVLHRGLAPPEPDDSGGGPTDLDRIVAAARDAAARLAVTRVPAPWLPPLPDHVDLAGLDPPPVGHSLPYALADRPGAQAQEPLAWILGGGHLAVVGAPRSGRSTVLRTLATSAGLHTPPGTVHVHVVDGGAGLRDLAGLPHVGTVAAAADAEHCARLLRRLHQEFDRRRGLLAAAGDWRAPGADAQIVVLIDGWESVLQHWTVDHGRAVDDLLRLVREGASLGIQVAIAGGRALLTGAVASLIGERVVLAMADAADAALAGVRPGRLPAIMPPGRCVRLGGDDPTGVEAQVAVGTAQPGGRPRPIWPRPWRLRPLPDVVRAEELSRAPAHDQRGDWIPVGVGGEDTSTVGLSLEAVRSVLVAGHAGSGRSSALAVLATGAARHGRRSVLMISRVGGESGGGSGDWFAARAPGILARLDPLDPLTPATVGSHPGAVVVVDDVEQWLGTPLEAALSMHLRAAGTTGGRLIAACETAEALAAYTGLLAEIRAARTGLLLGPTGPGESEALGVRLPSQPAGPPGRGLLVVRGRAGAVQVALPSGPPQRSPADDDVAERPVAGRRPLTAPW